MSRLSCMTLGLMLVSSTFAPIRAELGAAEAETRAREIAVRLVPELDSPETKIVRKETDQVVALELSDPFTFNGQVFWRLSTVWEWTAGAVNRFSWIGNRVHEMDAGEPGGSDVPDALRGKVLEWLAFWDAQGNLDPGLKVSASTTKVYLFNFHQGLFGPNCVVGIDSQGRWFRPNPENRMFPWRTGDPKTDQQRFESLHASWID